MGVCCFPSVCHWLKVSGRIRICRRLTADRQVGIGATVDTRALSFDLIAAESVAHIGTSPTGKRRGGWLVPIALGCLLACC